ncbi:type IV pilus secretin PilQ [Desulfatibacillum aliphaticivorans]|uniref:type IV pilus secretin PilQ n=1 Tax=Desulfatibacillum aliphaticivorans TaxID=218208 RepID=UPI000A010779|nr:AMIN domain-containing protein [Desulfatibacillum aliphaticivorans]
MGRRRFKQLVVGALVAALLIPGVYGCSVKQDQVKPQEPEVAAPVEETAAVPEAQREITGISVGGDENVASVLIRGNANLMYTAVKSPFNNGVVLYFPETALAANLPATLQPASPLVKNVMATQADGQMISARVEISLSRELPYEIKKEDGALYVLLGREEPVEEDVLPASEPAAVQTAEASEGAAASQTMEETFRGTGAEDSPEAAAEFKEVVSAPVPAPTGPVWLTGVNFLQEPAGRSSIKIEVSQPIQYKVTRPAEKRLVVELPGVQVPKEQQRPLITTRFESAADRIVPYARGPKDTAVSVELRQMVAYHVEQTDQGILLHLEASDIPPRPLAQAALPRWESIMRQEEPLPGPGEAAAMAGDDMMGGDLADYEGFEEGAGPKQSLDFMDAISQELRTGSAKTEIVYTGEKIALDFYKTDIKNVFRILKEVSGLNFAIDRDVEGEVTLTLEKPVPWDQVLHLVLKMNQLGMQKIKDVIRIAPQSVLDEEAAAERAREQANIDRIKTLTETKNQQMQNELQQQALEPMVTEFIPVNYTDASDLIKHVEAVKSPDRGSVDVDIRTNTIIMIDIKDRIKRARDIVSRLDRVTAQVQIEARVVEAQTTFSRSIGLAWNGESGIQPGDSREGVGPQRGYDVLGGTYGYNWSVNYPTETDDYGNNTFGFNFSRLLGLTPLSLNATLNAAESRGEIKIVSSPKIRTLDNKPATIKQGIDYPIKQFDGDGNTVIVYKAVDLQLEVTPHVTQDRRVSMKMTVEKNDVGAVISEEQSFNTKEVDTELLVNDGDTVVIGGIIKTTFRDDVDGWPGLIDVPVLGWLFKDSTKSEEREELLVFITPTIVELEEIQ